MPKRVYKVCATEAWIAAEQTGFFIGSTDDVRDGFIHLSSAGQLAGTLRKHFPNASGLLLLAFDADSLSPALRLEASPSGQIYPHLYGSLPVAAACQSWPLPLDAAGIHILPGDLV